ncbi:MAG: tRNA (adenosine(37)-N6)-threonylcarbamoyltransferase complex dimerization subunit type 1 TsaB, partial [Clostridia bacterium]|nr:tRNA (adenosine(37)-N6)-threonylcarbamoyltransferase complex dimerization subunit type 1 TsaB [Clostridia bacterium]
MKILAIDTSGQSISCAITDNQTILAELFRRTGAVHSRALLPLLDQALAQTGLSVQDMDALACVAGPGSFTGVRIGVCTLKGLAMGANKPCAAVNTLDCLRENLPFETRVCPILDARRGEVYTAVYERGARVCGPDALNVEELAARLAGKDTVFLGDGVPVYKEKLTELLGDHALFAPPQCGQTRAVCAALIAARTPEAWASAAALDAFYLRKPQAEREYEI